MDDRNTASKLTIPQTISKPGMLVFPFPEVFGLCFCSGVCSTFAVVFSVLSLVCVSFTNAGCVLVPVTGCILAPLAVILLVIVKGENPGVSTVKYTYLSSSLRNDKNIISSISVADIIFDEYLGKWNYRAILKVKT